MSGSVRIRTIDKFLATALAATVRIIVSGDKHLLRVSGWHRIEVLKPRQFVDRYIARAASNVVWR